MEKIKKSVISGEFIIEIDKTGHVSVYRIYDNVIDSLREIYKTEDLEFDPTWNTRQMGNNLIKKYCTDDDNTQAIIGDYLIQRRENGSIETFRDYGKGKVTEALKEVAQKVGLKVESGWNTQQLGSKLVDFIKDKPQNTYIMQEFKLDGRMTVSSMKELFKTLTGGTLRVKDGGKKADESATLASIRKESDNKSGAFALNPEMTVGDFKAKMLSDYGLKVEVGTPDDWVSVPDGITLGQLRELPKNAVKAQLEALIVGGEKKTEKSNTQQDDTPQFEQSPDAARVEYSEDGTELLCCPEDFEGTLIIPRGVKKITKSAFEDCCISNIIMTDDVISLGDRAFYNCVNLSYVRLSNSIKNIPTNAFAGCEYLTEIKMPDNLQIISEKAFLDCSELTDIKLPNSLKSIRACAFKRSGLESVVLPESVMEIYESAFEQCGNLSRIKLSNSLRYIDENVFSETALKEIIFPDGIERICQGAFNECPLEIISLPSQLQRIESYAFHKSLIENINIPSSVKSIEPFAFGSCKKLKKVTILSSSIAIGNYAFDGCIELDSVKCDGDNISISSCAFDDCEKLDTNAFYKNLKPCNVIVDFKEINVEDLEDYEHGILMITAKYDDEEDVEYIHQALDGIGNASEPIEDKLENFEDKGLTDIKIYASQPMQINEIEFATQAYQNYFNRSCNFKGKVGLQGPGDITFKFPDGNSLEMHITWDEFMKMWECTM